MQSFIGRENFKHFDRRLAEARDENERRHLEELIAAERERLRGLAECGD